MQGVNSQTCWWAGSQQSQAQGWHHPPSATSLPTDGRGSGGSGSTRDAAVPLTNYSAGATDEDGNVSVMVASSAHNASVPVVVGVKGAAGDGEEQAGGAGGTLSHQGETAVCDYGLDTIEEESDHATRPASPNTPEPGVGRAFTRGLAVELPAHAASAQCSRCQLQSGAGATPAGEAGFHTYDELEQLAVNPHHVTQALGSTPPATLTQGSHHVSYIGSGLHASSGHMTITDSLASSGLQFLGLQVVTMAVGLGAGGGRCDH